MPSTMTRAEIKMHRATERAFHAAMLTQMCLELATIASQYEVAEQFDIVLRCIETAGPGGPR